MCVGLGMLGVVCALALSGGTPAAAALAAGTHPAVRFSPPLGTKGSKLHRPAETVQFSLKPYGYIQQEYLVSGNAKGNTAGFPQKQRYPSEPFTTRILVRRPIDPRRSNGTVVLEWMNTSLQQDTDVDWIEAYREILHAGFTYIGVSVQPTGVPLSSVDPVRYGKIKIPPYVPNSDLADPPSSGGPSYGESIFTQIAHALKSHQGTRLLHGQKVKRIIAVGESQSAERLSCYLEYARPVDRVFDGFMIDHGECAGPNVTPRAPFPYHPKVPTMFLDGMYESRPGMHNRHDLRIWEIAGASHVDAWIGAYGLAEHNWDDTGRPQHYSQQTAGNWGLEGGQGGVCNLFTTTGDVRADELPQQYAHDSALAELQTWITTGRPSAKTAPLRFDPHGKAATDGASKGVATDRFGNPLGGLRLPQIEVPVAKYEGTCPQEGQGLIGTTIPFTAAQLHKLYPTFADYRAQMCRASLRDMRQGVLLRLDALDIDRRVKLGRDRWPKRVRGNGSSNRACAPLYR